MLRRVDLPQPEGPMMETNSPAWTSRLTLLRAVVSTSSVRYVLLRLTVLIMAGPCPGPLSVVDRERVVVGRGGASFRLDPGAVGGDYTALCCFFSIRGPDDPNGRFVTRGRARRREKAAGCGGIIRSAAPSPG